MPFERRLRDPAPGDWLNARGNHEAWGYSPLSQINTENVDRLELAWVWGMEDGTRSQPAPLVHDGVMFLPNWGQHDPGAGRLDGHPPVGVPQVLPGGHVGRSRPGANDRDLGGHDPRVDERRVHAGPGCGDG